MPMKDKVYVVTALQCYCSVHLFWSSVSSSAFPRYRSNVSSHSENPSNSGWASSSLGYTFNINNCVKARSLCYPLVNINMFLFKSITSNYRLLTQEEDKRTPTKRSYSPTKINYSLYLQERHFACLFPAALHLWEILFFSISKKYFLRNSELSNILSSEEAAAMLASNFTFGLSLLPHFKTVDFSGLLYDRRT